MKHWTHHWEEVGRTYSEPRPLEKVRFSEDYYEFSLILEKLLLGATAVMLRCRDCGDVTTRVLTGRFTESCS